MADRHLYIREQNRNVVAGFQNGDRLIGVGGFDEVDRVHPEQRLIFDDHDNELRHDVLSGVTLG